MKIKLNINEMAKDLKLSVLYQGDVEYVEINTSDLNRPGLQMAGFFEYFADNRFQLFGMVEMTYLQNLDPDLKAQRLDQYFRSGLPCVLIGRNLTPPEAMLNAAKKYNTPILMSGLTTTKLSHKATVYLDKVLAPSISRHAGLMDVYGVGIMLTGDSGVGKSETALELVKRGHRLVADDVVEIHKLAENQLMGRSPEVIRHMMEIRGLGIIDVCTLYGLGAVMLENQIELAINLELGDVQNVDRLGTANEYLTLLGVKVPTITIPVRPGRNLAIIIEVASMNFRLKSMGVVTAEQLDSKLLNIISPPDKGE
ncbi:MAG: HPr(Ser) kinase/phosphatase [Clostridia bacterium]|jgi:HPr kinase/phosphorylase|nr:HPr(Ser) kinase/phosphatase [Clostridia bacterium]